LALFPPPSRATHFPPPSPPTLMYPSPAMLPKYELNTPYISLAKSEPQWLDFGCWLHSHTMHSHTMHQPPLTPTVPRTPNASLCASQLITRSYHHHLLTQPHHPICPPPTLRANTQEGREEREERRDAPRGERGNPPGKPPPTSPTHLGGPTGHPPPAPNPPKRHRR
jgi:hypothetical protein